MTKSDIITWLRREAEYKRLVAEDAITDEFRDYYSNDAIMLTAAADWIEKHE
jgi:hypothetical protein